MIALFSCSSEDEKVFQVVEIEGIEGFYNYSTSSFGYMFKGDSLKPISFLANTGDLIALDDDYTFYDGRKSYRLSSKDGHFIATTKFFHLHFLTVNFTSL